MLIGIDSTDSRDGGCTTHVALAAWSRLRGLAVRVGPRLVRLNPNIPHKTRGNGALCLELGHPVGPTTVIGEFGGSVLHSAERLREPSIAEAERAFEVVQSIIEELRQASPQANSGLVLFRRPPPRTLYEAAASRLVEPFDVEPDRQAAWGDRRGLVGAIAACAWPAERGTHELILYRERGRIGTRRGLDPGLGARLDAVEGTFDNWDPESGHLRAAPASPCPVLAGIRGTDAEALLLAREVVGPELAAGWARFQTNQATGDHLRDLSVDQVRPFDSVRATVRVEEEPQTIRGGHVFVEAADDTGSIRLAAYEPTKAFRHHVRALRPGDEVVVEGGVHEDPRVLALEAFTVQREASGTRLVAPECPSCGAAMRSRGAQGGYRCGVDGVELPARSVPFQRGAERGIRVTVPVLVRRHLQRPESVREQDLYLARVRALA